MTLKFGLRRGRKNGEKCRKVTKRRKRENFDWNRTPEHRARYFFPKIYHFYGSMGKEEKEIKNNTAAPKTTLYVIDIFNDFERINR